MQSSEGMMDREFVELAGRIGALPEAPLAMPKQQLEHRPRGLVALVARLTAGGEGTAPGNGARRGEH